MKVTDHKSNVKELDSYKDSRNIAYVWMYIYRIYILLHIYIYVNYDN